jgi:hypothetical protein
MTKMIVVSSMTSATKREEGSDIYRYWVNELKTQRTQMGVRPHNGSTFEKWLDVLLFNPKQDPPFHRSKVIADMVLIPSYVNHKLSVRRFL